MPTVPIPPSQVTNLPCLPTCEAVSWALDQSALRAVVLRKIAAALHRTHAEETDVSWQNCPHEKCRLAHDCLEGDLELGKPNDWGRRQTVVPIRKEA